MNSLQTLFHKTRLFWLISRYVWIFTFGMSLFFIFRKPTGGKEMMLVSSLVAIYVLLMGATAVAGLRKKKLHPSVRVTAGAFSLVFGFLSFLNLFYSVSRDLGILTLVLLGTCSTWLLFFGLQDLLSYRKPAESTSETSKAA